MSAAANAGQAVAGEAKAQAPGQDLLLWLLADRQLEMSARQALNLSVAEAKALRESCAGRFNWLRQLRALGGLLSREELAILLRARVAEQLIGAGSASDLAALVRVFDKVPERADLLAQDHKDQDALNNQPDGNDLSNLDLATAIAEARRLLAEIEAEAAGGVVDELPAGAVLAVDGGAEL